MKYGTYADISPRQVQEQKVKDKKVRRLYYSMWYKTKTMQACKLV
jgi:hypothetical protein